MKVVARLVAMAVLMWVPTIVSSQSAAAAPLWSWVPKSFECNAVGSKNPNSCIAGTGFRPNKTRYWGASLNSRGNCTNYAAFRLSRNGAKKVTGLGDAWTWRKQVVAQRGRKAVNRTPAVGAIAWWGKGQGRGEDGHVAYVERFAGKKIWISESSWDRGSRRLILTPKSTNFRYPTAFLHVRDAPKPSVKDPRVGAKASSWDARPVTVSDGYMFIHALGENGSLYYQDRHEAKNSWSPSWKTRGLPPGVKLVGRPVTVVSDGYMFVHAIGSDGSWYYQDRHEGANTWSAWKSRGRPAETKLVGSPTAVVSDGYMFVHALGANGAWYYQDRHEVKNSWSPSWKTRGSPPGVKLVGQA